jgi:hypothetical protein
MAKKEDHSNKENGVGSNPTLENTQVEIRWDSSNIRSAYANVFNASIRADSSEKVNLLFRLMKDLNVELGLERSFKISQKALLHNRFLLGTSKSALGQEPRARILDICERMDMPKDFFETCRENLSDANYVHFGFEENERTCIYKVYVEFYEKIEREIKKQPNQFGPLLLYLGYKWDASDNAKGTVTRYDWYRLLSVDEIVARFSHILDPHRHGRLLEIASGIVSLASARVPSHDILYLEVSEENNPRVSFDINLYKANLTLEELYPFLMNMCLHYSIPSEEFHMFYDRVKNKTFGHLSGGIGRDGNDFLTVYYGVEGIDPHESQSILYAHKSPLAPSLGPRTCARKPLFTGVEATDEKARVLFQLVKGLGATVGLERSFKFFEKTLLSGRLLLGFRRKSISQEPHESILNICKQIDMPGDFLETFQQSLAESNIVLFGFERNQKNCIYKAYLEFADRITQAIRENPDSPEPVTIHRAFKWDASDNSRRTTATYTCFPLLTAHEMLERLVTFYSGDQGGPFSLVKSVFRIAATRTDPRGFLYFEASEPNNPRSSFDINMYQADLRLGELYPLLLQICWHYGIPYDEFNKHYEPIKTQKFGHLTGGVDREGRDFLTVYFGEKGSSRQLTMGSP